MSYVHTQNILVEIKCIFGLIYSYIWSDSSLFKKKREREKKGIWVVQSVMCPTLGFGSCF